MPPKPIRFFLDENLPPNVARALALVGYPIAHPEDHAKRGAKDPALIAWLAQNHFVWITKDQAARKAHGAQLKREGVSVVWVRGLAGSKNVVNTQQVHLMLTVKLPEIMEKIQNATGPLYFKLSLAGQRPKLELLKDDVIGSRRSLRARRSR